MGLNALEALDIYLDFGSPNGEQVVATVSATNLPELVKGLPICYQKV